MRRMIALAAALMAVGFCAPVKANESLLEMTLVEDNVIFSTRCTPLDSGSFFCTSVTFVLEAESYLSPGQVGELSEEYHLRGGTIEWVSEDNQLASKFGGTVQ